MKQTPFTYGASSENGKKYWRSLDELADSPEFQKAVANEFPEGAAELTDPVSRRSFMSLMGASMALAGVTACRRPEEKILPYSKAPEQVIPGIASFYATAMPFGGTAYGLLVESHEGRPTKIEGNPKHPESLGAANAWIQAAILDLYDPDRSTGPRQNGQARKWSDARTFINSLNKKYAETEGEGLAILSDAHRSPTTRRLLEELSQAFPKLRTYRYTPVSRTNVRKGAEIAFGTPYELDLDLHDAKVVLTLDADIFGTEGSPIRHAAQFAAGRRLDAIDRPLEVARPTDVMNRLYSVESRYSITGSTADHRLRLQSRNIGAYLAALANELVSKHGISLPSEARAAVAGAKSDFFEKEAPWIRAVAKDLAAHKGSSAIVVGENQPARVHALAALLNVALDNRRTVVYHPPFSHLDDGPETLSELARSIEAKQVSSLFILGGNPVFDAPADIDFAALMGKVENTLHLATHVNETSAAATWHLNRAHFLESWSDVEALNGVASVVQPLIAPLHGGRTDAEVLSMLAGKPTKDHKLVQQTWKDHFRLGFEAGWRKALHEGTIEATQKEGFVPELAGQGYASALNGVSAVFDSGLEITFAPSFHAWDGSYANNGWMLELPDPMTKLTWDNAAVVSPATARKLGLRIRRLGGPQNNSERGTRHETNINVGDTTVEFLEIAVPGGGSVKVPALVSPGQTDDSIALTFGLGRSVVGKAGTVGGKGQKGVGFNIYPLRSSENLGFVSDAKVSKGSGRYELAVTQEHHSMEGRALVREADLEVAARKPDFAAEDTHFLPEHLTADGEPVSVFANHSYDGYKWGMSIDLNSCIGCNACMIACQAENNIPLVGKAGVLMSREMHWIRIDRYYSGSEEDPKAVLQPVTCMHCENAPCETVCPVSATTHSPEGLNDMAYNRCVGTRYCANNCPYKVRRFNYFNYTKHLPELQKMQQNPNVTVRMRGTVEKCSFCVQRINEAKIVAKRENRNRLQDGEIKTACQQTCPTQAIIFGDLNDPSSEVARLSAKPRGYKLLEELNVRPRTTYLARVRNPNTELESA